MRRAEGQTGQVVVEMVLILPVFLAVVFMIMEIGFISFRVIVLNHATYEVARVAGMTSAPSSLYGPPSVNGSDLGNMMRRMLPNATVQCTPEATPLVPDPQSGQMNYDLICVGTEKIELITRFNPISSAILSDKGHLGEKTLQAVVRMPVEQPFAK